jgi:selenocysteine lyase/cysteine desulfurase
MNDDVTITALLHKYGALAFWDYAAAAPYVKIDMNPKVTTQSSFIYAGNYVLHFGNLTGN